MASNLPKDVETPYALTRSSMQNVDGYTIHALDLKKQACCSGSQLQFPVYTNHAEPPVNVDPALWEEFKGEVNKTLNKSFRSFMLLQLVCFIPFIMDVCLAVFLLFKSENLRSLHHLWHALFVFIIGYIISEFLKERLMRSEVHPNLLRLIADWSNKFEEKGVLVEYVIEDRGTFHIGGVKPTESFLRFQSV
jgi:hypothetical protein